MSISTKFPVAVHILSLLAFNQQTTIYSDFIASSVNTNPVVIRRIIGLLKKADLVHSAPGIGGVTLAKKPKDITLYDIYKAVTPSDKELFSVHQDTNPACIVGRNIQHSLEDNMRAAEMALENELNAVTLADEIEKIQLLDAQASRS